MAIIAEWRKGERDPDYRNGAICCIHCNCLGRVRKYPVWHCFSWAYRHCSSVYDEGSGHGY